MCCLLHKASVSCLLPCHALLCQHDCVQSHRQLVLCVLPVVIRMLSVTGRDAWSHAYQPGEIRNITTEEAKDYLVNRGIDAQDAEQLVKVPQHCQAISANFSFPVK